jgi:hypothetical protein
MMKVNFLMVVGPLHEPVAVLAAGLSAEPPPNPVSDFFILESFWRVVLRATVRVRADARCDLCCCWKVRASAGRAKSRPLGLATRLVPACGLAAVLLVVQE